MRIRTADASYRATREFQGFTWGQCFVGSPNVESKIVEPTLANRHHAYSRRHVTRSVRQQLKLEATKRFDRRLRIGCCWQLRSSGPASLSPPTAIPPSEPQCLAQETFGFRPRIPINSGHPQGQHNDQFARSRVSAASRNVAPVSRLRLNIIHSILRRNTGSIS